MHPERRVKARAAAVVARRLPNMQSQNYWQRPLSLPAHGLPPASQSAERNGRCLRAHALERCGLSCLDGRLCTSPFVLSLAILLLSCARHAARSMWCKCQK
jgi:hypothetical protein